MPKIKREVFNDVTPSGRTNRFLSDQSLDALRQRHRDKFDEKHPDILEEFKSVHGGKYDYSRTEYLDSTTKLVVICPIHGQFLVTYRRHVQGTGCPDCGYEKAGKTRTLSQEKVIQQFCETHGDKYDYSKFEYHGNQIKSVLICKDHGEFLMTPHKHKRGGTCPSCRTNPVSGFKPLTENNFLNQFRAVHGTNYDYSASKWNGSAKNMTIICPVHGEFQKTPYRHRGGSGCPGCRSEFGDPSRKLSQEFIISRFKETHGEKYDYSKVIYRGNDQKIVIICPVHGEFKQLPTSHRSGAGCRMCYKSNKSIEMRSSREVVLEKFKSVHGDRYDYSKVNYQGSTHKVVIICRSHGEFSQTPSNHLKGHGCNRCGIEQRITNPSKQK